MKIMVETSARHIHVTKEVFATLFGADATLTKRKIFLSPVSLPVRKRLRLLALRVK